MGIINIFVKTKEKKQENNIIFKAKFTIMKAVIALLATLAIVSASLGGVPGGYTDVPVEGLQSNESFMEVLHKGLEELRAKAGLSDEWTVKSINTVKSQVVAGVNYKIGLTLSNGSATKNYEITVFYQPWTNTVTLSSFNGDDNTEDIQTLGGYSNQNGEQATPSSNPQLESAIDLCLSQVEDNQLQGQQLTYQSMSNFQTQVVAGLNYKFTVVAKTSNGDAKKVNCVVYFPPGSLDGQV